jgi:DNA-binding NtrC family response regulator
MVEAFSRAHAFAPAATPVILHGESGTGKTFFADYIHQLSRRPGELHVFSVGTVAPQLAADELFGHVRGAYTDAHANRPGRIATAGVGTLLLDDLHTLDLGVQKQLLQVLDRGSYTAVGGDRLQTVACRMVFTMTEDPDTLMRKGLLLKDLRYRFGECGIAIPSLCERRGEIPLLARRALQSCAERTKVDGPTEFSDAALALLCEGDYEGNVRQLEGIVLRAYLIARHRGACEIDVEHLPPQLTPRLQYRRHGDREANRTIVERTLRLSGGNVKRAARLLGVSRATINALRGGGSAGRAARSDLPA